VTRLLETKCLFDNKHTVKEAKDAVAKCNDVLFEYSSVLDANDIVKSIEISKQGVILNHKVFPVSYIMPKRPGTMTYLPVTGRLENDYTMKMVSMMNASKNYQGGRFLI